MKKSLNPLVTGIIGIFIGGLLVFVYLEKKPKNREVFGLIRTSPKDAREMIMNLHTKLRDSSIKDIPALFARSYSLSLQDLLNFIGSETDSSKTTRVRLYPGLRKNSVDGKDMLSFVVMLEKNGIMQWDITQWDAAQNIIQDQWTPCPDECPGGGGGLNGNKGVELLNENDWKSVMGKDYVPVK